MTDLRLMLDASTHQIYALLRRPTSSPATCEGGTDRGAVTLEQVLWFVAAGVSVAVVAAILWAQIKDKADDPVTPPVAP